LQAISKEIISQRVHRVNTEDFAPLPGEWIETSAGGGITAGNKQGQGGSVSGAPLALRVPKVEIGQNPVKWPSGVWNGSQNGLRNAQVEAWGASDYLNYFDGRWCQGFISHAEEGGLSYVSRRTWYNRILSVREEQEKEAWLAREERRARRQAREPLHLSMLHSSPKLLLSRKLPKSSLDFSLRVAMGGSYSKLKKLDKLCVAGRGGRRGDVITFSRASAGRLCDMFHRIDLRQQAKGDYSPRGISVTLTYPAEWPVEPTEWKRHLDNFGKSLRRDYPGSCVIWALEFQERGAPHFHMAVFGIDWLPFSWVNATWKRVAGIPGYSRTETQAIRKSVSAYFSKYISKGGKPHFVDQETGEVERVIEGVGRYWGVIGRENLPIEEMIYSLTEKQFYSYRRAAAQWISRVRGGQVPEMKKDVCHHSDFSVPVPRKYITGLRENGLRAYLQEDTSLRLLMAVQGCKKYVLTEVEKRRIRIEEIKRRLGGR
jgi:hypothetical protein